MDWTRKLLRHKEVYRTINLPCYISERWVNFDEIHIVYDEAANRVTIAPVRPVSGTKSAQATAQASRPKPSGSLRHLRESLVKEV